MPNMNKTTDDAGIRAWSDALTSGKFEQARGTLRQHRFNGSNAYCCLGVKLVVEQPDITIPTNLVDQTELYLHAGLIASERAFFIWLNDGVRLTFTEIALVIDHLPREDWSPPA